ncbi:MAG: hypothetical protein AAF968_15680 [Pseudomonadota bacterium]
MNKKSIELHVPVIDKSGRDDGSLARADFTFDAREDRYLCPAGKELLPA